MNKLLKIRICIFALFFAPSIFGQAGNTQLAAFAGFGSNAPVFGLRNDSYQLKADHQYLWLSTSIGLESSLKNTKKSSFITHVNYQPLPNASMSILKSESTLSGVYTRNFDSLITKTDNFRLFLGIKYYFKERMNGYYFQVNGGINLLLNKTSMCDCERVESVDDNFYSESGTYTFEKRKSLLPELGLTFGRVFPISDHFALDVGIESGMPFGKMKFNYVGTTFPIPSSRIKVMNLNALFLTSLFELHGRILLF